MSQIYPVFGPARASLALGNVRQNDDGTWDACYKRLVTGFATREEAEAEVHGQTRNEFRYLRLVSA